MNIKRTTLLIKKCVNTWLWYFNEFFRLAFKGGIPFVGTDNFIFFLVPKTITEDRCYEDILFIEEIRIYEFTHRKERRMLHIS